MRKCDLCGYENESVTAVQDFPDGVLRCQVCVGKLAYGRFITKWDITNASEEQLKEWKQKYNEWYKTLGVTDVGSGSVGEAIESGDWGAN